MKNKKFTVKDITTIALMAALVFVATNIKIDIPTPLGKTMVHMGNIICVLSGMLFGPVHGGLAAGIGSAIFDLTDPVFAPEFWITFIMKFCMGYIAGKIAHSGKKSGAKIIIAALCGIFSYRIIYVAKEVILHYFILKSPWETVLAVLVSTNLISILSMIWNVIASILLYSMLAPHLKRAGIIDHYAPIKKEKQNT
ncbi:MAG: ECF transporter S component [Oscillospiraceae bacterium]|nr:ECF transporter S component [Oscillospiraceae bacterium]